MATPQTPAEIREKALRDCIERIRNYANSALERAKEEDYPDLILAEVMTARTLRELADTLYEDLYGGF